ncbi:MAG: NUDIX domain-containing protein [Cyclobacteriaceae bacterium]
MARAKVSTVSASLKEFLRTGHRHFLRSLSVDNVIFGFHENQLKVLLLHTPFGGQWGLPGGFVGIDEPLDKAAARVLRDRTGLNDLYLQQFHTFGDTGRRDNKVLSKVLKDLDLNPGNDHWTLQRFVTVGYFALVEYAKVNPQPDDLSTTCAWHDLDNLPTLLMDHGDIINKALEELRIRLKYQPIGYNLLPKEFPMKNLQSIYETVLGRKLDRANFNRKMIGYDILDKKKKLFTGGSHKAPYLYSFNKKKYFKALENGLGSDF